MKQSEVSKLSIEDLNEKLEIFRKNYVDLKMTHTISPLESPIQLRELRRTVARLTTELNKRD
ncbi:MAG: 50S ribosomal protein L29 [Flavobacteriaceae bacterium]|nr:50S ribosomal protein L29 [Flavobacteriaceae bacterium]